MKRIKLISDTSWLRKAIFVEVLLGVMIIGVLFSLWYDAYTGVLLVTGKPRSMHDFVASFWLLMPLYLVFTIALLAGSRRCVSFITLYSDRIEFKYPFCKKQEQPYRNFPDLYRASYDWFGKHEYIILTNQRYSYEKLTHANWIFADENTIKIRYSKKNHQALLEILPRRQKSALIRCFGALEEANDPANSNRHTDL